MPRIVEGANPYLQWWPRRQILWCTKKPADREKGMPSPGKPIGFGEARKLQP